MPFIKAKTSCPISKVQETEIKDRIDEKIFTRYYQDGSAEKALEEDLSFTHSMGIRSLPAYLIQYKDKGLLMQSFNYQDFINAIERVTISKTTS